MFSRTEHRGGAAGPPSIIGADMVVSGDIESAGSVQIEGRVTGDVRGVEVTVGRAAEIRGQIEGEKVEIHGTVTGGIHGASVVLTATARVSGDIVHERVSIEAGAHAQGQLLRRDAQQAHLDLVVGDNG